MWSDQEARKKRNLDYNSAAKTFYKKIHDFQDVQAGPIERRLKSSCHCAWYFYTQGATGVCGHPPNPAGSSRYIWLGRTRCRPALLRKKRPQAQYWADLHRQRPTSFFRPVPPPLPSFTHPSCKMRWGVKANWQSSCLVNRFTV
jgi:hypothetical protein